ncbi:DUF3999 domain-containing protein [Lampropedia aestuarii]|uniref:DUF3999 domain-containing protein n=1 Tax=Lampropedia aestuarii TaxID=2562762 RepID=A0A4S5BUH1_9BURK|nr:DUF3999 family protein [Lampropedia aestuarii]THJ34973.1 DUF3999 domain-containing protein [Lampropedia aestuarii]
MQSVARQQTHQNAGRYAVFFVCAVLACVWQAQAQPVSRFALSADLAMPASASVVRMSVPTEVLAGMHSQQGDDLRLVNGVDAMLPFAITAELGAVQAPAPTQVLRGYRIEAPAALAQQTPSLRIIENDGRRLVELGASESAQPQQRLRGLLFDTRAVDKPVQSIEIRGELPRNELLQVTLMGSRDLKDWYPVAQPQPLFQFDDEGPGNSRIRLNASQSLKGQYLRLSWADSVQFPEVDLALEFEAETAAREPDYWPLGPAVKQGDTFAEWLLPAGYAVQGLRLQSRTANSLLPVRILTRERDEQPWRMVGNTVVYSLPAQAAEANGAAQPQSNAALAVAHSLSRQLRIEVDQGFSLAHNPIEAGLEYTPMQVVFVASGPGPFRLLAGADAVPPMRLPLTTVMPGYQPGMEHRLPEAQVLAVTPVVQPEAPSAGFVSRWLNQKLLLWGILILAVCVLAAIALSVLRTSQAERESGKPRS